MFLAQLNLSKQHTPSWAVKRADRDTNSLMRERHSLESFCLKTPLSALKRARKEGVEGQRADGVKGGERDESHSVWSTVC